MSNPQNVIRRLLQPILDRIAAGIARGYVHLVRNSEGLQTLQLELLRAELRDGVEHFQPYGFEAVPLEGAEALVLHVGNSRDHPIAAVVTDRRHRPTDGTAGMVGLYDDQGQVVRIYRDRIELASSTRVQVVAPTIDLDGDVEVAGNVTATGEIDDTAGTLAALRTAYNAHTHVSAGPGNPTSGPTPTA